jgi:predicted Zn-dependent protease
VLTRDQAKQLVASILSRAKADETEVTLTDGTVNHLRFARNSPSTSGSQSGPSLTVRSMFGKKSGQVTVNQLDDPTLVEAVARAEEMARLAPDDPELMPALGAQEYAEVAAYFEESDGAARMAKGVAACIDAARAKDFVAAGFAQSEATLEVRATSRGLFGYHQSTSASFSATVRSPDATGSGYTGRVARRIQDLDFPAASAIAVEKAAASQKPRELKPGAYRTILEPSCVANLVQGMGMGMDRRRADEGRSYFASKKRPGGNRLGEKLFSAQVDIRSDPSDPRCPGRPWGDDNVAQTPRAWIDRGVLKTLACDRYWATEKKTDPVPRPSNLLMAGGKGTITDLIRSTKKGVLVTSFFYIRSLDPQTMTLTGLTRDGVFWIENGEIAYPVNNFRWNDSPISVLKKIEAMSETELAPARGADEPFTVVPALRVSEFNFASISDAV